MLYNYDDAPSSCHLSRRHTRSLDLDESAAKAAAWVWHLHTSKPGITTEGQFIFPQTKRRHSGTFDQRASRFQQEASTAMAKQTVQAGKIRKADAEKPMWDCGSSLYDTFELVTFGNSLDRSLMDIAVPFIPPQAQPDELDPGSPPSNVSVNGIARAMSLPRSFPSLRKTREPAVFYNRSAMDDLKLAASSCKDGTGMASKKPEKATTTQRNTVAKFLSKMKKAVVLRTQMIDFGCKRSTNAIESSQIRPIFKNLNGNNSAIERELTLNPEVIGSLSAANLSDSEGTDNRLFTDSPSFRYDYISESRSNYKLSNPMITKDKLNYDRNYGRNQAGMPRRIRAVSTDALNGGYSSVNLKITPRSESLNGEQNEEIRSDGRRKHAENGSNGSNINDKSKESNDCVFVWNGSKSGRTGAAVRGRIEGASEHKLSDLHKHLHHHHHHHHHHHYLHQSSKSEAARPYKQAMVCVP